MQKLEIENLKFSYKNTNIINGLSLTVKSGDICGLIGPSGIGKTTLLRIICGLEIPTSGTIKINSTLVNCDNIYTPPEKRNVGLVFQDFGLFPHLTVEKNIAFGLHRYKKAQKKDIIDKMLSLVNLKAHKKDYPYQLSGGQQQRVALARSLAPSPSLLLLDEPFSNLDSALKSKIRTEIKEIIKKSQTTCILSTHDKEDIEKICDSVIKLS